MNKPGALVTTTHTIHGLQNMRTMTMFMKPKIYRKGTVWYCLLNYFNGAGKSPREAFLDWQRFRRRYLLDI